MIATWMLYAIAVGALVIAAAVALERAARAHRIPTRFIWTAALVAAVVLPLIIPWISSVSPSASRGEVTAGQLRSIREPSSPESSVLATLVPTLRAIGARIDGPLMTAWFAVTVLLLGRVVVASISLWRQRARWVEREIDGVPLFVTPDLGPAVVAMPDTRIIVPEWILSLDSAALSTVIRHERQHSAAGDPRLILAGSIAVALLPWNPAVWYGRRRLRLAVEMDCDARVLSEDPRVDRYGSLLLAIAQHPRLAPQLSATLTESTSDLERRIDAMTARPPKQPRLRAALFASLALAAIVFACSMPAPDVVAPRANEAEATVIERVPAGQVMFEFQVETPAAANPTNKPPSYPAQLRTANIEGAVTASFVVDTNGKADMATFQVFKSDHDAFTNAVRQALPSMNFFPARVGDRTVKQLVMMPFSFSLVQGSTRPARVAGVIKELERVSAAVTAPSDDRQSVPTPLATNMPPVYPNQLRAANIEGQVIASFLVKADGTVDMSTFTVEKSDHDGFRAAVRDAVSSLRFKPAIGTGGAPIPQTLRMPFLFTLART